MSAAARRLHVVVLVAEELEERLDRGREAISFAVDRGVDSPGFGRVAVVVTDNDEGESVVSHLGLVKSGTARTNLDATWVLSAVRALKVPILLTDLAGLFDGPSTVRFDPTLTMVSLDLSRVTENATLVSVLMTCASAWMESALLDPNGGQRWVVYDEAWRLMSHPALLRRMDAHWRLAPGHQLRPGPRDRGRGGRRLQPLRPPRARHPGRRARSGPGVCRRLDGRAGRAP